MTGTHTQNPIYSRITLALMEDSGWYLANYEFVCAKLDRILIVFDYRMADNYLFGKSLGCDFAMRSCGDWIRLRRLR